MRYLLLAVFCLVSCVASGEDEPPAPLSVKDLAAKVRLDRRHQPRRARRLAAGAGHRLRHRQAGLIATNLHVIGEARPIAVQTADGKSLTVKAVHASDRALDLAILQVEATDLPALELADGEKLAAGRAGRRDGQSARAEAQRRQRRRQRDARDRRPQRCCSSPFRSSRATAAGRCSICRAACWAS